jgi:hypothetical protein
VSFMKMSILCLLKSIVYIKYFEVIFLNSNSFQFKKTAIGK